MSSEPRTAAGNSPTGRTRTDVAVDLLIAYKWFIAIGGLLLAVGLFLAGVSVSALAGAVNAAIQAIPPQVWTVGHYALIGSPVGFLLGWFIYQRFQTRHHMDVLEHWPHGDDHGHLWIGEERMRDATVVNLQGDEVTQSELRRCTVNGWPAIECVAYSPETNVFVAAWMGGASTGELRSYRFAIEYVMQTLAKEADESIKERVAAKPVSRMAGKEVVNHLIEMDEKATMPEESDIADTFEEATDRFDVSSPLDAYESDGEPMADQYGRPQVDVDEGDENGHESPDVDPAANGHGGDG